jgi:hypothetical protein
MLPDYYEILRVPNTADLETIKKAYRARALECHPDRGGSHEAMLLVIQAFQMLANPESRRHYDESRREQFNQNAQVVTQADISRARQKAEEYPRDWKGFESWSETLMKAGAGLAKGTAIIFGRYILGGVLCIIGYVVANAFGIPDDGSSYGSIGLITVLIIGFVIWEFRPQRLANNKPVSSGGSNAQSNSAAAHIMFAQCRHCGQQLRVTWFGDPIKVRCPKCRSEFYFDPTSRP